MSKQVAYQLADEKYAKDILLAAEEELIYAKSRTPFKKEKSSEQIKYITKKNGKK